jgi:hypothetical protein
MHTLWQVNWAKATAALQGKLPFKHDSNIDQSTNTGQASYTSQHTLCCTQVCIVVPRCTLWQVPAHIMAHTCMHHGMHAGTKTQAGLRRHKEACTLWWVAASCMSQSINPNRFNDAIQSRSGKSINPGTKASQPGKGHFSSQTHLGTKVCLHSLITGLTWHSHFFVTRFKSQML